MNARINADGVLEIFRHDRWVPQICVNGKELGLMASRRCSVDCPYMDDPYMDDEAGGYKLDCCHFTLISSTPIYEDMEEAAEDVDEELPEERLAEEFDSHV